MPHKKIPNLKQVHYFREMTWALTTFDRHMSWPNKMIATVMIFAQMLSLMKSLEASERKSTSKFSLCSNFTTRVSSTIQIYLIGV